MRRRTYVLADWLARWPRSRRHILIRILAACCSSVPRFGKCALLSLSLSQAILPGSPLVSGGARAPARVASCACLPCLPACLSACLPAAVALMQQQCAPTAPAPSPSSSPLALRLHLSSCSRCSLQGARPTNHEPASRDNVEYAVAGGGRGRFSADPVAALHSILIAAATSQLTMVIGARTTTITGLHRYAGRDTYVPA